MREGQCHHGRVVDIGIPVVFKFKRPPGRLGMRSLYRPVAFTANLAVEQPVSCFGEAGRAAVAGFAQRIGSDGRIPNRGKARLEEECLAIVNDQVFKLANGFFAHGRIGGITQNIERHYRILHGRINRAQSVRVFHALQHPVFAFAQGVFADTGKAVAFPQLQDSVGIDECLAPAQPGIRAVEARALARNEEFGQSETGGYGPLRIMGMDNRQ